MRRARVNGPDSIDVDEQARRYLAELDADAELRQVELAERERGRRRRRGIVRAVKRDR